MIFNMQLLIDGYNLFKYKAESSELSELQMGQYISLLHRYACKRKLTVLLVFDGGRVNKPTYEYDENITIVHVGFKKTADDFIKQYVQEYKDENLMLVSSDRELNRYANDYGIASIGSADFWYFVYQAFQKQKPQQTSEHIYKTGSTENQELDNLMQQTKMNKMQKDDDNLKNPKNSHYTYSKTDKKLVQKLKKL